MTIKHDNGYGTTYIFDVVNKIPVGFEVWNIPEIGNGEYIPICQVVDYKVNTKTLKAIKLDREEVTILHKAASAGIKTADKAKRTLSKAVKTAYAKENRRRAEKALPILEKITSNCEDVEIKEIEDKKEENIELKTGDIIRIDNAYFKNDNGLYFVSRCPGDAGWIGKDYSLRKICKNGKISTAKYSISFWPLSCTVNSREKAAEARAWNEEHATITKVDGINTEFVVEHFMGEAEKYKGLYEDYIWRFGAENEVTLSYKEIMNHYKNVVARMTCSCEDAAQEEDEETEEIIKTEAIKEEKAEEAREEERTYYAINEETARISKEINSFSEYKAGSATEEYRNCCDKAYNILGKIRATRPEQAERAEKKVDYYCRKLAQYYNDYYRNEASCPSVMICGAGNFPVKKKERQNNRRETLYNTWKYLENYFRKIEDILTNKQPIKSGDSDAIEKLTAKIEQLEKEHKIHMDANRYYSKNGTLKGFDGLEEKEAEKIEDFIKRNPFFPPFFTNNESANIRRYKERLKKLTKEKESGTEKQTETDEGNNGLFTVVENKENMRLQILFGCVPPESARNILKSNGFRWSPKNKAWQRQLTDNARYAYKTIRGNLKDAMLA